MNHLSELSHRHLLSAEAHMTGVEDTTINGHGHEHEHGYGDHDHGLAGHDWAFILYPRITGSITVICSLCMATMAWKRRKFVFHRLVFGMAIHQIIYGMAHIVGVAAIPKDVGGYVGNIGTWGTCTAQGFFHYFSVRAAMLYYACFSVYSYVGVMCCFDRHKYSWCEKWIHTFVHLYPTIMGVYYLFTEGYNPGHGFCVTASYPYSCELSEEVTCIRGPDRYGEVQKLMHLLLPLIAFIVLPTALMGVLYYKVRGFEANPERGKVFVIQSRSIAIQSSVYLSTLYLCQFPFFISGGLRYYSEIAPGKLFPYVLVSQINLSLFGLWSMLAYRYFSVDPYSERSGKPKEKGTDRRRTRNPTEDVSSMPDTNDKPETTTLQTDVTEFIFNTGERSSSSLDAISVATDKTDKRKSGEESPIPVEPPKAQHRYSFNIFDGTNASGAFAEFIHEGDSEDERLEKEETERWAQIQSHI